MNRAPVVLNIDQAEYLLDQMPAPEKGEDEFITKLRDMLRLALEGMRAGAEGTIKA
ncbi:hypothetical protein BDY24DRAFT_400529 [Mrakia frigida]|uniref:uncharacterized protein n=1 Tax=Mrakia frigida TaxID=29902 RepID=UPI003FCBF7B2